MRIVVYNNNVRWDLENKATNHGRNVASLQRIGLASAYHVGRGELHGKETLASCYARSKADGPQHHIDLCFVPLEWCSSLRGVELGTFNQWVASGLSSHVPLVVEVDLPTDADDRSAKSTKAIQTDL